ncbi:unnamed protein product [Symbiodinium sp. CCMP2456]|nr:unnamed protein product [Symbiodinium sp. CCMP2456]
MMSKHGFDSSAIEALAVVARASGFALKAIASWKLKHQGPVELERADVNDLPQCIAIFPFRMTEMYFPIELNDHVILRRRDLSRSAEGEVTSREGEGSRQPMAAPRSLMFWHMLASWEARRAKHYNEFAAVKALRKKESRNGVVYLMLHTAAMARRGLLLSTQDILKQGEQTEADSDSSVDSDTSDEAKAAKAQAVCQQMSCKEAAAKKAKATNAEDGQKGRSDGITSGAGKREGDSEETSSGLPGEECEASFVPGNPAKRFQIRWKSWPQQLACWLCPVFDCQGGRPPVQFGEDAPAGTSLPSSEFLAQRRAHYDEGAALRSKHSEDGASPGGLSDMDKSAAANPMDPTEPQEAAVSFKVETVSGDHQGSGTDAWRSKRNAHYRDMAAAFRSKPPVSDGDSEDSS